ncbi:MAG: hypothetical protein ACE5NM_00045 [Sedimentisphaerales bacterium]
MKKINNRPVLRSTAEGGQSNTVWQIVAEGRRIIITSRLILGLLVWVTVCSSVWLALFLLDNILHLPPGLRLAIGLGVAGFMIFVLWKNLLSPVLNLGGLETTALFLERKYNVPENLLVNALYFEGSHFAIHYEVRSLEPRQFNSAELPFAQQTIKTAVSLMTRADLKELWQSRRMKKWLTAVLAVALLWGIYGVSNGRFVINALARFVMPLADVPPAGSVVLKITPDSDVTIAEADDLRILAEVKGHESTLSSYPEVVWLEDVDYVSSEKGNNKSVTMQAEQNNRAVFSYTFTGVQRPFAFRVFTADTYSRSIKVSVNTVPRIKESQFHITPPAYTGLGRVSTLGPPEAASGLADSQIAVDVKLDKSAEGLWFKAIDETIEFKKAEGLWRAETWLRRAGSYQIEVKGPGVDRHITIASGAILLQQDSVPQIEFVNTQRSRTVNPGERLNLDIQASDDFGLAEIYVTLQQVQANSTAETIKSWRYEGPPGRKGQVAETLLLSTDASVFKPGCSYILQAFCQDFSPMSHIGKSQPVHLKVRSLDELTISQDDPSRDAFAALQAAIEAQQLALGVTKNTLINLDDVIDESKSQAENVKSLQRHQNELGKRQKRVGMHMTEAWDVSSPPRPKFVDKLIALRDGEHARVLEKIDAMCGSVKRSLAMGQSLEQVQPTPAPSALRLPPTVKETSVIEKSTVSRSLQSVERLQTFLLDQLIALKGIVAKQSQIAQDMAVAEILGQSDELLDTSADVALEEMVKELDEFIKQQKQIMQQRQMIMDKPPEDLSSDDELALEELALDQSKLAEILSNVVEDFTNLELLDFGDDAMVESMKSIYEQADELAETATQAAQMRQARVDAYRLETQAVEMAEELMINCEATLGVYDNIQFIAEIPEDEQLVAPLAELPSELEDLIADLVTSEEEMRPEVEDIGSYLTSLDHTAGPVADGTISSTSAKGKTGDQKPEDNVIQGRSGAGRSGMSDGQLVEPLAKALPDNEYGLRERISSTPLESGQVKDEDTQAQTGGTGLGKTTDHASMFGPGGRLPPKVLDMMRATAEKQLNIRQSARQILPKLSRHNLPTMELEKSIQAMKKVVEAINSRSGIGIRSAYDEAVNTLEKSYQAVGKQIAVQYTRDKDLAKKLQDMLSQKQQYRFRGYEHMISAYFEALAKQKANSEK